MRGLRPLLLALIFLTRLPIPFRGPATDRESALAVACYPLAGLIVGFLLVAAAALLAAAGLAPLPAAAVVVALWAWLSGGLHLDGLADTADAWIGGQGDRERSLAIMKDPACGPAGVTAIVLVLLLKTAALAALLDFGATALVTLLLAPALARGTCALLFLLLPYLREGGLGATAAADPPRSALRLSLALTAGLTLLLAGATGLAMLVTSGLVLWLGMRTLRARLGGFTGDTAGAMVEAVEVAALLATCLAVSTLT